nr:PAS domain S-box protein [Chromobacterium sp. ASV5]
MLGSFFIYDASPSLAMQTSYNPWLVALSLLIAILTSGLGLQIAGIARQARERWLRQAALLSGSISMGGGIWAMHFIGMLAFSICSAVQYAFLPTLLSMTPAIFASWIALRMLAQERIRTSQLLAGGALMGCGIGVMHYSGMAALRMAPLLRYDPFWFAASIAVAIALSTAALWIRYGLRRVSLDGAVSLGLSSVVMAGAIAGSHYFGMTAARFIGAEQPGFQPSYNEAGYLALAIALLVAALGSLVMGGNILLRYRPLYLRSQASEAKLQAILDTTLDGMITIDAKGTILTVNPAVERFFGWQAAELQGQNIKTLMPEPYRSEHDGYLLKHQLTGVAKMMGAEREVTAQHRDGSLLPICLTVGKAALPDQTLYVGVIRDISGRKLMERELAASEQQFRSLIGNIPGVTFRSLAQEPWLKIFISGAIEKLCGWPAQVFLNGSLTLFDLAHPDDREPIRWSVKQAMQQQRTYVIEYRIRCKDGSERWVSESGCGVFDDNKQAMLIDGVILDITETKRRRAELEGTVHAISRAMAMAEFDLDGHIRHANQQFLKLTGYRLNELIGQHHSLFCLAGEQESVDNQELWQALRKGLFRSGEFCRRTKDGSLIWIQAYYNPILGADGRPCKVIKLAADLTERKLIEIDLVEAKNRAEAATASKSAFLAHMSHEIRTPMNAIIGYAQLLLETQLDAQQRQHLEIVHQSADNLLGLLNDILDTAKLEHGSIELDIQPFSLRELCQQTLDTLRLGAESKGLKLTLDYPSQLGDIFQGDAYRLRQILLNLLGNAIKFTERGEVSLAVSRAAPWLTLAVRDSGIGMSPQTLNKIFQPFAQADASTAQRFGGTGLGTTIARQLAERMEGRIEVESELGKGSVFKVILPLQRGELPPKHIRSPSGGLPMPPLDILIVDDVPQNLNLLQILLKRRGHHTSLAVNGQQALEQTRHHQFDLVLMDVQMPEMDGLTACRLIREGENKRQAPPVPIIALTASVQQEDKLAALEAGMSGFASKPINVLELEAEIARVLDFA